MTDETVSTTEARTAGRNETVALAVASVLAAGLVGILGYQMVVTQTDPNALVAAALMALINVISKPIRDAAKKKDEA